MRAVALVAHPDDCVIFAWPFIEAHPEFIWEIVYLTYRPNDARAREVTAYWQKRNVPVFFLGYNDTWLDMVREKISFDTEQATTDINNIVDGVDLILTHHEDGDYGHIHHKFVNTAARQNGIPKVYFASTFNYNKEYHVHEPVDAHELPLHRSVIEEFTDRNTGRYIVTPEAELIIKNNK
jgi:LmbE family N-acetylglucosaminyl deacetylase